MSQQTRLSPLKQAFLALQQAQGRIANLEAKLEVRRAEPVALIGVGCRIPGAADGPEGYWALLRDAKCAVSEQTMQRWRDFGVAPRLGTEDAAARWSALLDAPDSFDPQFFGISPREAANMDPQQKLLMEVSWEALEDAAIAPGSTYGSRTGVYFGISSNDFAQIELADSDESNINSHLASGGAHSVAAGRVSYTFGWHGPAISIDTACSSSLVAVHLACEAIRGGDCDVALAGGVNLILSPTSSVAFARSGMLSSCGRVDAFGLGADGFVRGEGCGVVVLKRLSAARRDGDRVLAVILGSAVNHDGPGSGLTVPNGQAQAALLRSALASAGIAAGAVGYVEAHGTGTRLGDPIEAEALGAVFAAGAGAAGAGARERRLAIGSVKTNLGHLESAAGIAGLIKVVLSLEHGEIPAQLHGDPPSEHVRWSDLPLEVVRDRRPWEPIGGRRIAGVSAFGFSGTNAHVIVEEAAREELRARGSRPQESVEVLALSAKSAASLQRLAERYAVFLTVHPELDWGEVCYTAAMGRTHFRHRLAVVASSGAEAVTLLRGGAKVEPGTVLCGGAWQELKAEGQASGKTGPGKARDLAEAYVRGAEPDWAAWHGGLSGGAESEARRRIRLPGYAFERERHWITGSRNQPRSARGDATGHPLLGERLRLAGGGARYEWQARPTGELTWLGEHRIAGRAILPATAYLEMLLAVAERLPGGGPLRVEMLHLITPLEAGPGGKVVQVVVEPAAGDASVQGEASRGQVRVYSLNEPATRSLNEPAAGQWRLHGEGHVSRETPSAHNAKPLTRYELDLEAVRERCPDVIEAPAFYARMEARGAEFGPRFQRVQRVWRGNGEALGEVAVDPATEAYGNRLHPACLDACLQVAAALLPDAAAEQAPGWLPARIEGFEYLSGPLPSDKIACVVHVTRLPSSTARKVEVQIAIYNQNQTRPAATLEKIIFERLEKSEPRNTTADWIYALTWEKSPLTNAAEMASTEWVIASSGTPSERSLGNAVADTLRSKGQQVVFWDLSTPHGQPTDELQLKPGSKAGILYLHETLVGGSDSAEDFTLQARLAVEGLLDLCQSVRQRGFALSRLYVLTCNAHGVSRNDHTIYPLEAVVSGLAATISAEYESLRCVRIDLDATDLPGAAPLMADEMIRDFSVDQSSDDRSSDDWIAFRGGERYLPRLERMTARNDERPLQIAWTPGQGINSLALQRVDRRNLNSGEVEIEVRAAGLNFHDVLSVLGVLPDTDPLGSECSGIVSRIGPGVGQHRIGDEVVAMAAGALATAVITPQDLVFPKPDTLSFEQAASVPIAYLTAAYCLMERGALADGKSAGKRVLIHAATGGVGLAAVNLCKRYGAEIFATAGSEAKRAYLRSLGVTHVMDSRSAAFAEEIKRITHGHGVDIVLNCLAGVLTDAGLSTTASSGDFIDIGATDLRDADKIAVQYPGVRYHAIDLAAALRLDRDGLRRRLGDLIKDIGYGVLPPLPVERFALNDAAAAFRHMAASRHIGKIVLGSEAAPDQKAVKIVPGGSYIVTGGMTGLGLEVTQWLSARGAGKIVVGGRRGPSPHAVEVFERLRGSGAEVVVVQGDIADSRIVSCMVEAAGDQLRGVLHCAGAVHDAPLADQTWETFSNVLRAKADGAWLLHEQTRSKQLDFFVLFSSWASIAGSAGAANYCAANTFLDALAHHRHAMGLPATSIDWGPWARVGMATAQPEESFAAKGLTPMLPEAAIQALEHAIQNQSSAQIAIADVDWPRAAGALNHRREVPTVYRRTDEYKATTSESVHRNRAISKPPTNGIRADPIDPQDLPAHVRRLVLEVLELPHHMEIDPVQPLQQLGLDSILAVELAGSISTLAGRLAPSGLLFDYPTLAALTAYVTEGTAAPSVNASEGSKSHAVPMLDRLEEMTDQDVERLLRDKMYAG